MPYKILWVPDIFLFDAADSISWNIWQTDRNLYLICAIEFKKIHFMCIIFSSIIFDFQ